MTIEHQWGIFKDFENIKIKKIKTKNKKNKLYI